MSAPEPWNSEGMRQQVAVRASGRWMSGPLHVDDVQRACQQQEWWNPPACAEAWTCAVSSTKDFGRSALAQAKAALPFEDWCKHPWRVPLESGLVVMDFDRRQAWGWRTAPNRGVLFPLFVASSDDLDNSDDGREQVWAGHYREAILPSTGERCPLPPPNRADEDPANACMRKAYNDGLSPAGVNWSGWVYCWKLMRTPPGWVIHTGGAEAVNELLTAWETALTSTEKDAWRTALDHHRAKASSWAQAPALPALARAQSWLLQRVLEEQLEEPVPMPRRSRL